MAEENKFVVYLHVNPIEQNIFYVGLGTEQRAHTACGRNILWHEVVSKYGYQVVVIERNLSCLQAQVRERFYIKQIGRIGTPFGTLTNLTDGGEGFTGFRLQESVNKNFRNRIEKGRRMMEINRLCHPPIRSMR